MNKRTPSSHPLNPARVREEPAKVRARCRQCPCRTSQGAYEMPARCVQPHATPVRYPFNLSELREFCAAHHLLLPKTPDFWQIPVVLRDNPPHRKPTYPTPPP